jgi:hypothetical protein
MPKMFSDADAIADEIVRDVGKKLVVGLPLGLGKANHIVNALYARAAADRSIDLTFFSALTLEKPKPSNLLEARFITPVIDRLFGGYPDLAYAEPLRHGQLPPNIRVVEFFFLAGRWMHVPVAQQNYTSANYTHAASYLLAQGLNVVTQLVAKRVVDGIERYSLSCNTDTTLDVLRARGEGRASFKLVAQVNSELPYMPGPGDLPGDEFAAVLDSPATDFPLFAPPAEPISDAICHRPACRLARARRRQLADRHRAGRRCPGAGPGRASQGQRAVRRYHAAAVAECAAARDRVVRQGDFTALARWSPRPSSA